MIKELQKLAAYKTADMGAAAMTAATAQAMQDAAKNEGGAMLGFAGVNMAQQMSGINAGQLYAMSQGQQPQMQPASQVNGWNCPSCGQQGNTGKFCQNCGSPKPESTAWVCPSCGQQGNTGKFCQNCGAPRA